MSETRLAPNPSTTNLGMAVHTYNPCTLDVEAGGSGAQSQGQAGKQETVGKKKNNKTKTQKALDSKLLAKA